MTSVLLIGAYASSFVGGMAVALWALRLRAQAKRRQSLVASLGSQGQSQFRPTLETRGITASALSWAVGASRGRASTVPIVFSRKGDTQAIRLAGLEELLSPEGVALLRMRASGLGLIAGCVVGGVLSPYLGLVLALGGFLGGMAFPSRALREEAQRRSFVAERQLSQMLEIVVLGLQSGMSFDRSLSLYCQYFSGSLSAALVLAMGKWTHNLSTRSAALQEMAQTYDSILFDRFAENVTRSLRFGTSLADNLSSLSAEARSIRKAKLEELVAKAPVKMLLPVGALILPAMLILILGPILLDLMQDF